MEYLKVIWIQSDPDYPLIVFSELDEDRWETRKIEVFQDGTVGFAHSDTEVNNTRLGERAFPSIEQIGKDEQFHPYEISAKEFESVWSKVVIS